MQLKNRPNPKIKTSFISKLILVAALLLNSPAQATDTGANVKYIPSSRNLGISTMSPNELLTVNGHIALKEITAPGATASYGKLFVDSTTANLVFLDDSGTSFDLIIQNGSINTSDGIWHNTGTLLRPENGDGAKTVVIGGTNNGNADIALITNGAAIINNQRNQVDFRIESQSGKSAYAFYINESNGYIGLNTSTPKGRLDIQNGAITLGDYPGSSDPAASSFNSVAWLSDGNTSGNNGDTMVKIASDSSTRIFTLIDFDNGNTPTYNGLTLTNLSPFRLVKADANGSLVSEHDLIISSSNNLGVGTQDAVEKLSIAGILSLDESTSPAATAGYGKLYVKSTDSNLYFLDSAGSEFDLLSAVGVSDEWLDAGDFLYPRDNSGAQSLAIGATSLASADIELNKNGNAAFNKQSKNKDFRIEGSSDINLFFTKASNDRVGIGTNNPSSRLEVNGMVLGLTINGTNANSSNINNSNINSTNLTRAGLNNGSVLFADLNGEVQENNSQLYWNRQANELALATNGSNEKLTINGRVALSKLDSISNTSGFGKLYVKTLDSNLYFMDDAGTEKDLLSQSVIFAINDLSDAKTSADSLFLASGSGANNSGNRNTAAGEDSLYTNTSGNDNSAMGHEALYLNSTGNNNTAIGSEALKNNTASNNTAAGYQAALNNTSGTKNLAIGNEALEFNQTGSNNTAIGYQAGTGASGFSYSNGSFLGYKSAYSNRSGDNNTFIGYQSGNGNTSGENNAHLGFKAGLIANSNNNILLGALAGSNITSGNNNLIIGYDNNASSATASNQIDIVDSIYGNSSSNNIGIGINNLNERLNINGSLALFELGSSPSNTSDFGKLYVKASDHLLYYRDELNNEYNITDNGQTGSRLVWKDTGTILHPASSNGDKTLIIGGSTSSNGDIALSHLGDASFNLTGKNINFRIEGDSDSNLFFSNGSTGNIGIGLSNPNEKLTVEGEVSLKERSTPSSDSGYGKLYVDPSSSHLFFLDDSGIPYDIVAISNGGAAVSEWFDNGSFLYPKDSSGLEGIIIGGTSPASSNIIINAGGSAVFNEQGDSVGFRVESNNDENLIFADGTNDRVGIGNSAPSYTLDINGDITANDFIELENDAIHNGDADTKIEFSTNLIRLASGGSNFIDIQNGTASLWSKTYLADLNFNDSVYISESSKALGIGISSPNEELTVNGIVALRETSEPGNTTGFGKIYALNDGKIYYKDESIATGMDLTCSSSNTEWTDGGDFLYPSDNSGDESISIGGSYTLGDTVLYSSGAAKFNSSNNGSARFRIEGNNNENLFFANGNSLARLGIGIKASKAKLDLNGTLALFEKSSAPSLAADYGKFYVNSVDSNLYFLDESGTQFNLTPRKSLWANAGSYIYPNTSGGHRSVVHGGKNYSTADIILGANGNATFNYGIQVAHPEPGISAFHTDINNRVSIGGKFATNFGLISTGSNIDATISLKEISAPAATTGYGKLYVSSANSLLYFIDNGGNTSNLTNGTSLGGINSLNDGKTTSTSVYLGQSAGSADPNNGKTDYNVGLGENALQNIANGDANIAIGFDALKTNSGSNGTIGSIAIGFNALKNFDSGNSADNNGSNIAIGSNALEGTVNGALNIAVGNGALAQMANGKRNIAFGAGALSALNTGNGNIALGTNAGNNLTSGSNNIIIGKDNQAASSTGSNQLDIADLIYGDISSNKYLGINKSNPQRNLHVNGGVLFSSQPSPPSSPALGDIYYDSSGTMCFYNGSSWIELADLPGSCS